MQSLNLLLPVLLLALVVLMTFQTFRQRKNVKAVQELQSTLAAGDRVQTTSGILGTVVRTEGTTVTLEIAPGVHTEWDRRVIREKVEPTVPGTSETDPA